MIDAPDAALAARNTDLARDMLRHAHLVTTDATEQVLALITAATVIIEREVGTAMAGAALMAMVEPTLACWAALAPGQSRH